MRFQWPDALWLLLAMPVLIAAYLLALRRRQRVAARYASLSLIRAALGPGRRWRRHVPPALFAAAMTSAVLAIARPSATLSLPSEYLTLVLAMDVSRSMLATDIEPTRMVAAQNAAKAFIADLPRHVRLGITSFAGTAAVVQTPTDNRDEMTAAIDRFQLQRGTATGSGLLVALSVLFPDAGFDLEATLFDTGPGPRPRAAPIERRRSPGRAEQDEFKPVPPGSYTAGSIILLSDGRRTTGPDPLEIARMAADRGVRVYTVGFGSNEGAASPADGWSYYMRLDEDTLKSVARITGGEYFHAGTAYDLRKVYDNLNTRLTIERRDTEIGALFSAAAAVLLVIACALSLAWFGPRGE
ncbi:MAG: VWA domain-containing protein [Burkholderiaceae bacterium]